MGTKKEVDGKIKGGSNKLKKTEKMGLNGKDLVAMFWLRGLC